MLQWQLIPNSNPSNLIAIILKTRKARLTTKSLKWDDKARKLPTYTGWLPVEHKYHLIWVICISLVTKIGAIIEQKRRQHPLQKTQDGKFYPSHLQLLIASVVVILVFNAWIEFSHSMHNKTIWFYRKYTRWRWSENTPASNTTHSNTTNLAIITVSFSYCTLICRQSFFRTITFSVLHFGAVKYISGRRKMSAAWCFFDLSEAMCQLCKAEVSGTAESRWELRCEVPLPWK